MCSQLSYQSSAQSSLSPNMDTEDKLLGIKITDNDLFEQPPPNEDCPICMLPLPIGPEAATFHLVAAKLSAMAVFI